MESEDHRPASLLSLVPCSCVLGISTSICPEVGRERNMYVEIHSRVSWGWRARVDWDWCWDDRGCVYSNGYQILQLNSDVWLSSLDGYRKNVLIHVSYEHYVGLSVESMLSLSRQLLRGIAHLILCDNSGNLNMLHHTLLLRRLSSYPLYSTHHIPSLNDGQIHI
jgi:hypothetical protein